MYKILEPTKFSFLTFNQMLKIPLNLENCKFSFENQPLTKCSYQCTASSHKPLLLCPGTAYNAVSALTYKSMYKYAHTRMHVHRPLRTVRPARRLKTPFANGPGPKRGPP